MTKILFVCHGNICRSPMAEFVMKDMVKREGLENRINIESAATSAEEIGNGVYPPVRAKLMEHSIDPSGKRARQLEPEDYSRYDLIIGMDTANIRNMQRLFGGDRDGKIYRLLDISGEKRDVADPWYTRDFEQTWKDIQEGCAALLDKIKQSDGI